MKEQNNDVFRSFHYAEKTTDTPSLRVMALHAFSYCERLFYLEEVEKILIADANVYDGRRLHESLDKGSKCYTLELASEKLNLRGKLDCARRESGELVVHEYKRGRSKEGKEVWDIDRIQVLAYALLLAEHTNEPINKARVHYNADKKVIDVDIDLEKAEQEITSLVAQAMQLSNSLERPPVTTKSYLCKKCSLAPVCLPEEARFADNREEKPKRLFPADDSRRVVHVTEQGASIGKRGEQIIVHSKDKKKTSLPGHVISGLVLHGNVQISTQAIHFCAAHEIGVHWLSFGGFYVAALSPGGGQVQRKNRFYQALQNASFKVNISLRIVWNKVENQLKYVLRSTRNKEVRTSAIEKEILQIRNVLEKLSKIEKQLANKKNLSSEETEKILGKIRGYEGFASKCYFQVLPKLLNVQKGDLLYFEGRNRRPPKDPFNALLSFGYSLLYKDCVSAIITVGIEPALGFFHTPRSAAYPLALDLMELFRTILWDIPLIASVNRKQWNSDDFEVTPKQVWLNSTGRNKAIQIYETRKQEKWKHPVLKYSLSYERTIELEAKLLEKEWTDKPGLFASLRIR